MRIHSGICAGALLLALLLTGCGGEPSAPEAGKDLPAETA